MKTQSDSVSPVTITRNPFVPLLILVLGVLLYQGLDLLRQEKATFSDVPLTKGQMDDIENCKLKLQVANNNDNLLQGFLQQVRKVSEVDPDTKALVTKYNLRLLQ